MSTEITYFAYVIFPSISRLKDHELIKGSSFLKLSSSSSSYSTATHMQGEGIVAQEFVIPLNFQDAIHVCGHAFWFRRKMGGDWYEVFKTSQTFPADMLPRSVPTPKFLAGSRPVPPTRDASGTTKNKNHIPRSQQQREIGSLSIPNGYPWL